ncbi:MAG: hypothetical protein GY859_12520, partial [Desulfobacterales bacterium]|nr:hypothetical protein [Desulfobacterales bacterium]
MSDRKRKRMATGSESAGFSLMELLLASMNGLIILAIVVSMFWIQSVTHRKERVRLGLQQNARATVDLLIREFRWVGFNAGATGEFTIVRIDLDESGNSIFGYTADVGRQG